MAFCFVLTKSRTAYVGLLIGLMAWGFGLARAVAANPRRVARWALVGIVTVVLVGGVAWSAGGVDRLVLSESGKSLRYRFEYWRGTWGVLRESTANLLLGVGSGNFRQHYLAHKLPESSEEVLDPHNMVLDVWVNGGLLGLAALGGLCLAGVALVFRQSSDSPELGSSLQHGGVPERKEGASSTPSSTKPSANDSGSQVVINGFILGGGLGFLAAYLTGNSFETDNPLPFLLAGWVAAVALCGKFFREIEISPPLLGAAVVALLVHLLGAGGIGMPAITQTLLVLLALGYGELEASAPQGSGIRSGTNRRVPVAAIATGLVLGLGCFLFGFLPVTSRENLLAEGSHALTSRRNAEEADAAFSRAAAADPLSAEPPQKQAILALQRAMGSFKPAAAFDWMEKAVAYQRTAIERDPLNSSYYQTLANYELEFGKQYPSTPWMERAAADFTEALARYPHNASTQSDLANAWWLAKKPDLARSAAEKALELHEINVRAGHPDKQLSESRLRLLQKILSSPSNPSSGSGGSR
ncbi:MAG: O-antigen ligase family protein [Planctomycetales bacterium]|nr:O-antigen ligase family protein [Planctomycetales bacterium]